MLSVHLDIPKKVIDSFCQKSPIHKLSLFGSVLRDDFRPDSDVDMIVEFEPDASITYFDLADIQFELVSILGREVNLLTPPALSPRFRKKVLDSAVTIYERS